MTESIDLLVLSVSAGNGHVRAAQALVDTAALRKPVCRAEHIDAMAYTSAAFRKLYTDWYIQLVNRAPEVWSYLHHKSDATPHSATTQRLRRGIERVSTLALLREVRRLQPKAVVCTHFLPAELLMREAAAGRLSCPVWLQVTDYDLHTMWHVPGMAGYFAANAEVAWRMQARGIPADRIHISGIPLMPAFAQAPTGDAAREAAVRALGLDVGRRVVLMASGGGGVGDLPSMVARALALPDQDFQVIAVAGRNAAAHAQLQGLAGEHPGRLLALGFTQHMDQLMTAADLVVSKPGGLTVSECLALGKPMLLVAPIPGQEEHNASHLLEEGAAWLADDAIGLDWKLTRMMNEPEHLPRLAARSLALGKPGAAQVVLDKVLGGST